jgi:NADP-dependent aldehyde dehydrogenase
MLTGKSFIGDQRTGGAMSPFHAVNPATGEHLDPTYSSVADADVAHAGVLAAAAASEFHNWPGRVRAELLRAVAARLEAAAEPIVARANLETALPLPRLQGELARTCNQLRMFAALVEEGSWADARVDHADPARQPVPKPDIRSMLRPLGPVAVFGASNFPLAFSVAGGDTAAALAAGCPVIVKAHPAHPGTSELVGTAIVDAIKECGAPAGVFSLLFDAGHDAGLALVRDPRVKAVAFTGSRRAGLALMAAAASRDTPIPVYAEMGSVNPICIFAGAQRERAKEIAAGLHASATLGVGQFCTKPGVVLVESCDATDAFLAELDRLFASTPPGVMVTPGICAAFNTGLTELEAQPDVHVRARGQSTMPATPTTRSSESWRSTESARATATLFQVDRDAFLDGVGADEIFGPCTVVVRCLDFEEMYVVLSSLGGQLTASVHLSERDDYKFKFISGLLERIAGRLIINAFPTGVEVCHAMVHAGPFPATGDGRSTSVGARAIERFTRPVCFQGFPDHLLPPELQEANPLGIWRQVDGERRR